MGWRGYFCFCQTARVLTNLEAWIRRRLRLYLWRQWRTRHATIHKSRVLRQNGFLSLGSRLGVEDVPGYLAASLSRRPGGNREHAPRVSSMRGGSAIWMASRKVSFSPHKVRQIPDREAWSPRRVSAFRLVHCKSTTLTTPLSPRASACEQQRVKRGTADEALCGHLPSLDFLADSA